MPFPQIAEREDVPTVVEMAPGKPKAEQASAALDLLITALGALSKKTVVALATLFTLATVGSAFLLWFKTPDPSPTQIISLSIYAAFVLAINFIIRR
jgi:hypothetical protein